MRNSNERSARLLCLTSHPIQYQAPLFKCLAACPDIQFLVAFCSDLSMRPYFDKGFNRLVHWDVPLLEDFEYRFLPTIGSTKAITFFRPVTFGLGQIMDEYKPDAIWITGYARWSYWCAIVLARMRGIRVLISGDVSPISARRGIIKRNLKRIFFQILERSADRFLAVGTMNRRYYRSQGVPEEKLTDFHFAVDNDFFRKRVDAAQPFTLELKRQLGIPLNHAVVLFAGKLYYKKRVCDLIRAFIRLSSKTSVDVAATLLIVGDGEDRPELEALANHEKRANIKFLGFMNQTELPRYFALCDLFVLPSEYESWGLVVNEAMNAACAILVSDCVGCAPDLVEPGVNGQIFQAKNISALAHAMSELLSDRRRLEQMGRQSQRKIRSWSFDQNVAVIRQILM